MNSPSLRSLCAMAGVRQIGGRPLPDRPISGLTDDSRSVRDGSCFVAVKGTSIDGHAFIPQAVSAGAAVVVVDAASTISPPSSVDIVRVADTREAVARLAAVYYGVHRGGRSALRLIGVTGTNGKSTVTWLIRSILNTSGERCALIGTIEYDLGGRCGRSHLTTPGALELCDMLASAFDAGARFAALEVSSHALDQRRCDGLSFDAGIFTNLSGDHLDYHRTMDAYGEAKSRLFTLCDEHATAIINGDDAYGRRLLDALDVRCVSYGIESPHTTARAEIRRVSRTGSEVTLRLGGSTVDVRLPLVGRHNVSNALAAALACEALGLDHDAIRRGLEAVRGVPGRLQRVEPDDSPFSVFVDYAHTDAALENVLTAVRPITSGRLICVFGCGGDRDRTKRPRMAGVVARLADVAFVTSDNPRTEDPRAIIDEVLTGFDRRSSCEIHIEVERRAAIRDAIASARPGDTVLIAGKGHEDYQLIGGKTLPFDDATIAGEFLGECGMGKGEGGMGNAERGMREVRA